MMAQRGSLLVWFLFARQIHSWGRIGHEIVGNVAWSLLQQPTQAAIKMLLNGTYPNEHCMEFCSPLANVADWADSARYSQFYHWSGVLHYIDIRDDLVSGGCPAIANSCHFIYERDCVQDVCVAGAVSNYTYQISAASASLPFSQRRIALKFLTHFVGDIHQPLHCSRTTDRGGNSIHVTFLNETMHYGGMRGNKHHELNLHAVWDDTIIEKTLIEDYKGSRNAFELDVLDIIWSASRTPAWKQKWLPCANGSGTSCTSVWAEESFQLALQYSYQNTDGKEVVDGTHLTLAYYQAALPIVQEQLALAGFRLASTLQAVLTGPNPLDFSQSS